MNSVGLGKDNFNESLALVLDEIYEISSSAIQDESTIGISNCAIAEDVIELAIDVSDIFSDLRCGIVESVNVDLEALLTTCLANNISELINNFASVKDKVSSTILISELEDLST